MTMLRVVKGAAAAVVGAALLAMTAQTAHAQCAAPNCFGAIAINTNSGHWGWSVNHPSRQVADAAANARCGNACNRTLSFANTCGAYALAANGGWGWATRYERGAAESEALRQCNIHNAGQGCAVRVWACTTRK